MKKIVSLLLLLGLILIGNCYASVSVPEIMRVGIYSASSAVSSFKISSESGMKIGVVDHTGTFILKGEVAKGKTITIKKGSTAYSVDVESIGEVGDENHFLRIVPNETNSIPLLKVNDNRYRGEIEVRRYSSSDMTVINQVSMQEYLYGVVPREIGGNSPIEAVKAQAIIARTYAAKNYQKRSNMGFNLKSNTEDQAYAGYDWENKNSNGAVDETDGVVATYHGELIGGYYFSTSGGYTESSENVWGGNVDYLEAVPDPYEPNNLPKTTWTVTYSSAEIEKMLANKGVNIGKVIDMKINEVSEAGRVLELEVVGSKDTYKASKSAVRSLLNLNSQWFTINDEEPKIPSYQLVGKKVVKVDTETLPKSDEETLIDEELIESGEKIVVEKEEQNETTKPLLSLLVSSILNLKTDTSLKIAQMNNITDLNDNTSSEEKTVIDIKYASQREMVSSFTIKGRGWGHSVGMSQNGAIGMAKNDFTAEEIIKWYYSGVDVSKK